MRLSTCSLRIAHTKHRLRLWRRFCRLRNLWIRWLRARGTTRTSEQEFTRYSLQCAIHLRKKPFWCYCGLCRRIGTRRLGRVSTQNSFFANIHSLTALVKYELSRAQMCWCISQGASRNTALGIPIFVDLTLPTSNYRKFCAEQQRK